MSLFGFFNQAQKRDQLLGEITAYLTLADKAGNPSPDARSALWLISKLATNHSNDPLIHEPLRTLSKILVTLDPQGTFDTLSKTANEIRSRKRVPNETANLLRECIIPVAQDFIASGSHPNPHVPTGFLNTTAQSETASSARNMAVEALKNLSLLEHERGRHEAAMEHLIAAYPHIVPAPAGYFDTLCLDLWTERNTEDELAFYDLQFCTSSLSRSGLSTRLAKNFLTLISPTEIGPNDRERYSDILLRIYQSGSQKQGQTSALKDTVLIYTNELAQIAENEEEDIIESLWLQERLIGVMAPDDENLPLALEAFEKSLRKLTPDTAKPIERYRITHHEDERRIFLSKNGDVRTFYQTCLNLVIGDSSKRITPMVLDHAERHLDSLDPSVLLSCARNFCDFASGCGRDVHTGLITQHILFLYDRLNSNFKDLQTVFVTVGVKAEGDRNFAEKTDILKSIVSMNIISNDQKGERINGIKEALNRWESLAHSEAVRDSSLVIRKSREMTTALHPLKETSGHYKQDISNRVLWEDLVSVPLGIAQEASLYQDVDKKFSTLRWILENAPPKSSVMTLAAASYTALYGQLKETDPKQAATHIPRKILADKRGPWGFRLFFRAEEKRLNEESKANQKQVTPATSPESFVNELQQRFPN